MKERWPQARRSAVDAVPLQQDLVATARGPLHLLFIAVGLVLLVVCVNVANLVLARATGRVQEFGIRSALGSGSHRLVRQMFVESLVLAGFGGLMGLVWRQSGERAQGAGPRRNPAAGRGRIRSCRAGICGARDDCHRRCIRRCAGAPFRSYPSRQCASPAIPVRHRYTRTGALRSGLAAAQLALALTLLIGAGVLLASFHRLQQVELGFRVDGVLTFDVNLPSIRYDAERRAAFQEELARRLRTVPGVIAAGGISFLPATGSYHGWNTSILSGPRAGTSVTQQTDSTSNSAPSAEMCSRRWRFRCLQAARSTRATTAARRRA